MNYSDLLAMLFAERESMNMRLGESNSEERAPKWPRDHTR